MNIKNFKEKYKLAKVSTEDPIIIKEEEFYEFFLISRKEEDLHFKKLESNEEGFEVSIAKSDLKYLDHRIVKGIKVGFFFQGEILEEELVEMLKTLKDMFITLFWENLI